MASPPDHTGGESTALAFRGRNDAVALSARSIDLFVDEVTRSNNNGLERRLIFSGCAGIPLALGVISTLGWSGGPAGLAAITCLLPMLGLMVVHRVGLNRRLGRLGIDGEHRRQLRQSFLRASQAHGRPPRHHPPDDEERVARLRAAMKEDLLDD